MTTDAEWIEALRNQTPVTARWGYPHDLSDIKARGTIVGYSANPMVLIQADDGEQFWWAAELSKIEGDRDQ